MNFQKSALAVSPGLEVAVTREMRDLLGVELVSCHAKYLGLPFSISRRKKDAFVHIRERVSKKVAGWKEKLFSIGGKEVLIKSVLQAIPTYPMSLFKLPVGLCKDIEKIASDFWWGYSDKKKNLHWQSWERLSKTKSEGGMGFRDIVAFNQAMLAKQAWRLIENPTSLMAKVLRGVYFPHTSFLKSKVGYKASFVWRSLQWGKELIDSGTYWRIGDGRCILVYNDSWLPRESSFKVISPKVCQDIQYVSDLILSPGLWDLGKIKACFLDDDYKMISSLCLSYTRRDDVLVWFYNDGYIR